MQAAGGDAAEVGADVAAVGQARTVAQQQPANHCCHQGAGGDLQARGEAPRQSRCQQGPQDDADVHHAGDVLPHRGGQGLGVRRALPEHPTAHVYTESAGDFRAPQGKGRGDAPWPPRQGQGGEVEQRQGHRAPDQRPGTAQQSTPALVLAGQRRFKAAVAAFFQGLGKQGDQREQAQAQAQGRADAEALDDGDRWQRRQGKPPVHMMGGNQRAADKERQGHQHPRIAAADGEQGARRAAAPQLHADAENEGTEDHRNPGRRHQPHHRLTEQAARPQRREKQQHRQGQHDHLCPQAGTAPIADEHPPGRGETEGGVVQGQPQGGAQQQQQHLSRPHLGLQEQGSAHQEQ
ncbi:hypothetical protein BLX41_02480 [Pseudomonas protegens]|nr:hypothetical protein BLX41_02480 [Pseudomonas protegens]